MRECTSCYKKGNFHETECGKCRGRRKSAEDNKSPFIKGHHPLRMVLEKIP